MNWHSQVLHVAVKDVRMGWWMILLFAVVVAAATAAAVERPVAFADVGFPWTLLGHVLAVVLCAVFVQADSPSRSDAFWVTRPLYPSAVLAARQSLAHSAPHMGVSCRPYR
jgi:hypothetical protein